MKEELKNEYPKSSNIPHNTIKYITDKSENAGSVHDVLVKGRKKVATLEK